MKKELKKLELKKLFKEFSFLKIDEEYKIELQVSYGPEFEAAIKKMLEENPDLNLLYNNSTPIVETPVNTEEKKETKQSGPRLIGNEIYDPTNSGKELQIYTGSTESFSRKKEEIAISEESKKLYRKIATKTHPDKVSSKYLNELYLKAKTAYQIDDVFSLYLICNDLDIEYEFSTEHLGSFKNRIKTMKINNSMAEQTYLWAWIQEENEDIKRNIILHFIQHAYRPGIKFRFSQ